jgi:hypothetical protein
LKYRLTRFGVQETAVAVAVIYFILGLIFVPIVYLASRAQAASNISPILMVIGPICYGLFGYIFTAIACWLYNVVSGWTGGIAITLEPSENPAS